MRTEIKLLLGAIGFGVGAYLVSRTASRMRQVPDINVTTADLDYKEVSYEEVASEHLTDLNLADSAELRNLGLDDDSIDRLIENRPYRSKLELVSRMIMPEQIYASIRDRIAVAEGRDPIKVA